MNTDQKLALFGGQKAVTKEDSDIFIWPVVTKEHENAVLEVLRQGNMSGCDITRKFEDAYAKDIGMKYALGCNNGTSSIHCGLHGIGVGVGDEVIWPSLTYWASVTQVYSLGATPVFCEVQPDTLCIDPVDAEKRITKRTKAIVVVHYSGMMADMDAIMALAKKHNIKVFEDCSHAHASTYKGKEAGTFGDASGFSLMAGKSFAIGEAGILFTGDQRVYERAILLGHYARHADIELPDIKKYSMIPCGGYKYRMHQLSSAFGLVQLKYYRQQFAEIESAMHYFCDRIDKMDGIEAIRPKPDSGESKGGWFFPLAHYNPEVFEGLSVKKFAEALLAEGVPCGLGCNLPLHKHPLFTEMDVYGHGKPTRIANSPEGTKIEDYAFDLPITAEINQKILALPWFKKNMRDCIDQHIRAFEKVAANYKQLLAADTGDKNVGGYSVSKRR